VAKIRMFNGKLVDPFDLQEEDIDPTVFAHHLCLINRFHGGTKYPYSVGQHSRNLYYLVPPHLKKAALIHDFQEAVFNDLASPVKYECPVYTVAEKAAGKVVYEFFGISPSIMEELVQYDKRIYKNERDALFDNVEGSGMGDERRPLTVIPGLQDLFDETPWRSVRDEFLHLLRAKFPTYFGDDYDN